ncbi:hypothetical protein GCM10022237_31820 [Nocardioides ginsengisoli]|uniref:Barstar family protein n=1 Tax=Nocardioides ginsengisoli TaxID=363868 RepID=A0ABW3W7G5_9ACTN
MSGLAAVLAGRHVPGVHRWESALPVSDVRRTVEHAGWAFGHVDGAGLDATDAVLRAIGDALAFPDYYGVNLDALRDCLRDLPGPTVLLWDAWGGYARAEPERFAVVAEILGEARLEVLLRGPGPDGLPTLQ